MYPNQWGNRKLPVVAAVKRHTVALCVQRPLMVTGAAVERHTRVIEQIQARRTVTSIITLSGTLHIRHGVQTHTRTRAALSLALILRQERHALRTHTCTTKFHFRNTHWSQREVYSTFSDIMYQCRAGRCSHVSVCAARGSRGLRTAAEENCRNALSSEHQSHTRTNNRTSSTRTTSRRQLQPRERKLSEIQQLFIRTSASGFLSTVIITFMKFLRYMNYYY